MGEVSVISTDVAQPEYVDGDTWPARPLATAVGGTQQFRTVVDNCNVNVPVMPYSVRSEDPQLATVTSTSSTFDVTALAAGEADILVVANGTSSHQSVAAAPIDHVAVVAAEVGGPGAFYVDAPFAMIELLDSTGAALVDRNLAVVPGSFARGDKWNHVAIGGSPAGQYSLAFNAGNREWVTDVTVVDHITSVTPSQATVTTLANEPAEACFLAHLDNVVVAGVPWQFDFDHDHGAVSDVRANCVVMQAGRGGSQKLMQTVTAHALGFTASATVMFVE